MIGTSSLGDASTPLCDIVIPTIGRPSLTNLLRDLQAESSGGSGARLGSIVLVDDRRDRAVPLLDADADADAVGITAELRIRVVAGRAAGPASARNIGWRFATTPWVVFLDDDVRLPDGWLDHLVVDLTNAAPETAGVQARIEVPLDGRRRPTDWQRNVAALETARWATADMAYRRVALELVGGFDERFPRAYREDVDLALRVLDGGWRLDRGTRRTLHPVRPAPPWVSVHLQAGNADDVLMAALHGRGWRHRAGVGLGARRAHLATAGFALAGLVSLVGNRRTTRWLAPLALSGWVAMTAAFAADRIRPGPRGRREVATMAATSVLIPLAASAHWLRGWFELPGKLRRPRPGVPPFGYPDAVFFDRDGTLVDDVPYNGDPSLVRPVRGARHAVDRLRRRGVGVGLVTNQSGVARGLLTVDQVTAVNARLQTIIGELDVVAVCLHGPDEGCGCRKPRPGLVLRAAAALGADPSRCVLIGDIGSDIDAAEAAGARGILVPTATTRPQEIAAAHEVVPDLASAIDRIIGGSP